MDKTIKQIADELGVSKTAVRKQIANLGLRLSLRKTANQFAIDEKQEALIIQAFQRKLQTKPQTKIANQSETVSGLVSDSVSTLVSMLQKELDAKNRQLEEKDRQLEAKDRQINELTAAVKTQAESINATHQTELAGKLIEGQQLIGSEADSAQPKKKGFIFRLFRG
jgi:predicted ArsR family transcriptional regulator